MEENPHRDLWVYKTWDRHCAILRTVNNCPHFDPVDYSITARKRIVELTRPNFFRGLAFGTILELEEMAPNVTQLVDAIDTRQRSRSVWQWIVILFPREQIALGIHTWMQVFLTPFQRAILDALRQADWEVREFKKEKDAVMKFLQATSPHKFAEYQTRSQHEAADAIDNGTTA